MATHPLPQSPFSVDMPPRAAIASAVETLLAVLDVLDGEADAEDGDPVEANGDESDGMIDDDAPNFLPELSHKFVDGSAGDPADAEEFFR